MKARIELADVDNLTALFRERLHRSPDAIAYRYFESEQWQSMSWSHMARHIARWQAALKQESLSMGERVAIMVRNCPQWVMFEQAALGLGLVVVPLYTNDRPDNIAYVMEDAGIKVLFIETDKHWEGLRDVRDKLAGLQRILSLDPIHDPTEPRLKSVAEWLPPEDERLPLAELKVHHTTLATIVYTSGTTGRPKGVMLSHGNILWNAYSAMHSVEVKSSDLFLSFLPLSHTFERTVGYYVPMFAGATVAYARGIDQLSDDLLIQRPTVLITVPRIFERVYNKIRSQLENKSPIARKLFHAAVTIGWDHFEYRQGRLGWRPAFLLLPLLELLVSRKITAKLGGRLRLAVSGGAPLSEDVARVFIGLGLTITQGYGLTETSPVICANTLDDNIPRSVGIPLEDVEVRLGENDELQIRSPGVMLGYWRNDTATKEMIDADGWLKTGDKARIDEKNHIYITGRIKEIIVLSNGEKVPPADLEMAITQDPLFDQVMVIGEGKPYLSAINVLNEDQWRALADSLHVEAREENLNTPQVQTAIQQRINHQIRDFPGYANIYHVYNTLQAWTVDNGLLTPTLKLKRPELMSRYAEQAQRLYEGH
jgi:long-chain acyl-CoA synthetase